ncbi:MAG: sugar phosphate isomerase/epimerase family protein [Chloroflexota bacterium]|nr:sugar phosphate isomerase/epimerase family protein [Chloroflexota bacterium]
MEAVIEDQMRIGAVSLGWSGTPLPQVFDQVRAMGGECLEINYRTEQHHDLAWDERSAAKMRAWAEAAGVWISGISGYNDFAQENLTALPHEVERLLEACRLASNLGVNIVRAFPGDLKPGLTLAASWSTQIAGFQQAARLAEPLGVSLAIENHGRLLYDGPLLARLVNDIGADNVGLTLDTGNFCWAGHSLVQAQADFEAMLPHVVNVHIKDGIWQDGNFEFVPAGQGELPLTLWLDTLVEAGYRGAVCSEFEGAGDFLQGTRSSLEFLLSVREQG